MEEGGCEWCKKGSGSSRVSEGLRSLKLSPRGSRSELLTEGGGLANGANKGAELKGLVYKSYRDKVENRTLRGTFILI